MLSESNGPDLSPILIKSSLFLGPARSKSGFREALWIPQEQAQKKPPPFPKKNPPVRAQPRHHQTQQRRGVSIASVPTFRVKRNFLHHTLKAGEKVQVGSFHSIISAGEGTM